jgi:hypothetical protein
MADVAKGGDGAESALREFFLRVLFCVLCALLRLFHSVTIEIGFIRKSHCGSEAAIVV